MRRDASAGPATAALEVRVSVAPGIALAVRRWDGGPPGARSSTAAAFLLVHGLASNARMWDGVAEVLSLHGHDVAAVDLRGHGQSDKPDAGYDFETVTDDLRAVVDALGLDRPVVVGQSWGGNLAIELAHRFPDLPRAIACVDGGLIELSERFPDWDDCARLLAPPRLAGTPLAEVEAYVRSAHRDWPESGIQGVLANFEVRADGTVAPWLTYDRHMTILRGLWEHRPSTRLGALSVPLLLVPAVASGEAGAEKQASVERARRIASRVRVRPFPDADHDIHAQHPVELAGVLHAALSEGFFS